MAEYTSAYTGAQIDAAIADAQTALQAADMATTVSLAASAVQPAYTGDLAITGNESITGNITFTGTGNRVTGDFNNATVANRVLIQTSTTNAVTSVGAVVNGSGTNANFTAYGTSDPDNSNYLLFRSTASASDITSGRLGTGVFNPLTINADGVEAMRVTASGTGTAGSAPKVLIGSPTDNSSGAVLQVTGSETVTGNITFVGTSNRITGDMSTTTVAERLSFQSSTTNGSTFGQFIPNGTSTTCGLRCYASSSVADAAFIGFLTNSTSGVLLTGVSGTTATAKHLDLSTISVQGATGVSVRARVEAVTGNVLIGSTTATAGAEKLQVTGAASVSTTIKQGVYTVATLPTGAAGMTAFVSDANATTFAAIVAAGGANFVPVYHNGTNWLIG